MVHKLRSAVRKPSVRSATHSTTLTKPTKYKQAIGMAVSGTLKSGKKRK